MSLPKFFAFAALGFAISSGCTAVCAWFHSETATLLSQKEMDTLIGGEGCNGGCTIQQCVLDDCFSPTCEPDDQNPGFCIVSTASTYKGDDTNDGTCNVELNFFGNCGENKRGFMVFGNCQNCIIPADACGDPDVTCTVLHDCPGC